MKKRKKSNIISLSLTMKLLAILFVIGINSVFAGVSHSQSVRFSLKLDNVTIPEFCSKIEKSSDYVFLYKNKGENNVRVSVDAKNETLEEILDKTLASNSLSYKISDRQVVIYEKESNQQATPQKKAGFTVKGNVIDMNGEPLIGVSVSVVGTSTGTTTNLDGLYSINVPGETSKLKFTYLGYQDTEEVVEKRRVINVTMQEGSTELDEVVVVAFGKQKKESIVSAISTISPAELKVPSSNLTTSLAGRMAGIISYQRSGEPGADNAEFFLRGITTFGFNSSPLILIDNIELTTQDLARLQADDIESFSIMKDATATALYGSRAANGVVFVKTKEGKKGSAKFNIRFETGLSQPTQQIDIADPVTYMKLHNESYLTRDPLSNQIPYSRDKIDSTVPGSGSIIYPSTDWQKEMLRDYSINERLNLNISGGGDIARYYVAASYSNDDGNLKVNPDNDFNTGVSFQTYTLRSNVNVNVTKTTELLVRLNGNFEDYTGPIGGFVDNTYVRGGTYAYNLIMKSNPVRFPAIYPKNDPNNEGNYTYIQHTLFGNADNGQYMNPYAEMVRGYEDYGRSNMGAQIELKQNLSFITKGLSARALFNTNRVTAYSVARTLVPFYYGLASYNKYSGIYSIAALNPSSGTEYLNFVPNSKSITAKTYFEAATDYSRTFHDHSVSGMLVFQVQDNEQPNATTLQESLPFRNVGLSGRFTYGYGDRYFLEANFGYNGSERFDEEHRYGFFPSVGAGWVVSNEGFFDPLKKAITKLKLRGSYGIVGNDKIGDERFLYLSEVNMYNSNYGASFGTDRRYSRPGISVIRYPNPEITWETAAKANLALELDVLQDWNLVAEVYQEHRTNILQARASIPYSAGLWTTPYANLGEAKGKGIDITLDYNKYFNKNAFIQLRGNFTYATSEYTVYEDLIYANEPWKSRIGYPTKQTWGYIAEGLFVDDADVANSPKQFGDYMAGDIKYRDMNQDGVIDELDQVPLGYPTTPEIVYGFGGTFGYKGFDFSVFFQGTGRESFWINYNKMSPFIQTGAGWGIGENALSQFIVDSYWSEDNKDAYAVWPRLSNTLVTNNQQTNSWFMRDGSFLRLKQLEFGYTIPDETVRKIGLKGLRVYLTGSNLLCFSKFKIWDPEMAGNGLGYPLQRVYNVGLSLNF